MAGIKKHKASAQKIRKSREEGQVASSRDVVHAVVLAAVIEGLIASRGLWSGALEGLLVEVVDRVASGRAGLIVVTGDGLIVLLVAFAALLGPVVLGGAVGLFSNGFLFSPKVLAPKFERIDPVSNAKNQYGPSGLSNTAMSVLKIVLMLFVGGVMLRGSLVPVVSTWRAPAEGLSEQVAWLLVPLLRTAEVMFVALAIVGFFVQRLMHARQLRMDDTERRRDHKEANGDPLVKSRLRSMALELIEQGPDPGAKPDVVLANPSHYAVGLLYRRGVDDAPRVLFKRVDGHALAAIDEATSDGALVVRSPAFTRALFAAAQTGSPVPADYVRPVAMVYRLLQELEGTDSDRVVDIEAGLLLDAVTRTEGRPDALSDAAAGA